MTFKEEIELQLVDNKTLSYEILSQLKNKSYFSGRAKQIGDTILFGMLKGETEDGQTNFTLVTFHKEEIGVIYEEDDSFYITIKESRLPNIKKIENGGN